MTPVALALGTLISEDLACIAAGVLVANGTVTFWTAALACAAGIFIGDVLLYLTGRMAGARAAARFAGQRRIDEASAWLAKHGVLAVFVSRFTPGLRLPGYVLAGALRTNSVRFVFCLAIAALLWTPLLVGATAQLGSQFVERSLLGAVQTLIFAALGLRFVVSLRKRAWRWEFWPVWASYLPLVPYLVWLAVKHRGLTFTASNPRIATSGFVGESKSDILNRLPADAVAAFIVPHSLAEAVEFAEQHGYPVVMKPDIGERGDRVRILQNREDLAAAWKDTSERMIVQRYVPGVEFGVFYQRRPQEKQGRTSSITEKRFPMVVGDGVRTIADLIDADDRASRIAQVYLKRLDGGRVPARGESVPLVEVGSHCKGAVFLDGRVHATPELEAAVDRISQAFEGFYFGRYDVRAASTEDFRAGRFTILELNGVTAEPTHIYDPAVSVFEAYRTLAQHWRAAFEIGAMNRAAGHEPLTLRSFANLLTRRACIDYDCEREAKQPWRQIAGNF